MSERDDLLPARVRPTVPTTVPAHEDSASVLAEILNEVEIRGSEGHWLSRDSPLLARARMAVTGQTAFRPSPALRDLVWRVEHVRERLAALGDERLSHLLDLLDTSDARAWLDDERTTGETSRPQAPNPGKLPR